ncbi:MAG: hypothetical protein WD894_10200 [Pirellulales bacterium]
MKRKKWHDPIMEELYRIREEHAKQFNYDILAMFRDLQEQQRTSGRTYISMPPERLSPDEVNGKPAEPS